MAARGERGPVRGPEREAWRCCTPPDGTARRGIRGRRRIRSGSRAPGWRARPLPVAERAQPPAMLRARRGREV